MSHLAINTFSSSEVDANAWISQDKEWPIWMMVPRGVILTYTSFTDGTWEPSCSWIANDRSKMAKYFHNLWGIIEIENILSSHGRSSFMLSHSTTLAQPHQILSCTSRFCWSMALGTSAEACGPHLTTAHVCYLVQGFPVLTGHPHVAYCRRVSATGCQRANPDGNICFYGEGLWNQDLPSLYIVLHVLSNWWDNLIVPIVCQCIIFCFPFRHVVWWHQ